MLSSSITGFLRIIDHKKFGSAILHPSNDPPPTRPPYPYMQLPGPPFSKGSPDAVAYELRAIGTRVLRNDEVEAPVLLRPPLSPLRTLSLVELCRRGQVVGPRAASDRFWTLPVVVQPSGASVVVITTENPARRIVSRQPTGVATPSSSSFSSSRRRLMTILNDVLAMQEDSDSSSSEGEWDDASRFP